MSAENVDLIRAGYERLENEGYETMMEITHPEFAFTTPSALAAEPDTYVGEHGIRRYFESFYEVMEEVHLIPGDFIVAGEKVVVPTTVRAKGRMTGIEADQKIVIAWRFRDHKIIGLDIFATLDEAMAVVEDADRDLGG